MSVPINKLERLSDSIAKPSGRHSIISATIMHLRSHPKEAFTALELVNITGHARSTVNAGLRVGLDHQIVVRKGNYYYYDMKGDTKV